MADYPNKAKIEAAVLAHANVFRAPEVVAERALSLDRVARAAAAKLFAIERCRHYP